MVTALKSARASEVTRLVRRLWSGIGVDRFRRPERGPVPLRGHAHAPGELLPEGDGGAEPDVVGDVFDRDVGGLQEFLGPLDPQPQHLLHGSDAHLFLEAAGEAAHAGCRVRIAEFNDGTEPKQLA